jgi:hypothetical protein
MNGNRIGIEDCRHTNKALPTRDPYLNVTAIRRIGGKRADTLLHEIHVAYRQAAFMQYLRRGQGYPVQMRAQDGEVAARQPRQYLVAEYRPVGAVIVDQ